MVPYDLITHTRVDALRPLGHLALRVLSVLSPLLTTPLQAESAYSVTTARRVGSATGPPIHEPCRRVALKLRRNGFGVFVELPVVDSSWQHIGPMSLQRL